jgi:hypothetical protein
MNHDGLFNILAQAKANNSHQDITGSLLYDGGRFIQILEGDKTNITDNHKSTPPTPRHPELNSIGLTLKLGGATYATLLRNRSSQQQLCYFFD